MTIQIHILSSQSAHPHCLFLPTGVVFVYPSRFKHAHIDMFTCDSLCLCTLFCILQEAAAYVDGQRGSLEENKEGIEIDPISFDSNSSGNEVLIPCGHSQSRVVLIKNTSASYVSIKDTPSFSINPQVCLRPRQNFSHLQCIHSEGSCRQCSHRFGTEQGRLQVAAQCSFAVESNGHQKF